MNHLTKSGFEAYLVGGSVRDLLLKKAPKDFDIATNATPTQIRNLFKNSRIIGRRFKLIHIFFHREIIEVATFRGKDRSEINQITNEKGMLVRDNVYGTLTEDAFRRDFTINSLYYNITDSSIIDFTGGFKDIKNTSLKIIGDPNVRYTEDPVRMLRAIRFSAKLGFTLDPDTHTTLSKLNDLICHVSSSRLFDEMTKMYQCGNALIVHKQLMQFGLFEKLFPKTFELIDSEYHVEEFIKIALENTDKRVKSGKPITPAFLYAVLLWFPLQSRAKELEKNQIPPLEALEKAMRDVIVQQNNIIFIPRRFTEVMREIWFLQYRFPKRTAQKAYNILEHPRFRAAYDFLALRAIAGDENIELANWWTTFQECTKDEQEQMIKELLPKYRQRRKRNPKKQDR